MRRPKRLSRIQVRRTRSADFPEIIELSRRVYPLDEPWEERHLASHLRLFPEGQFVAEELETHRIVGMAASLVIKWDDYEVSGNWFTFTDGGFFTNHDPVEGRTLYGAEVMVDPTLQGQGVGSQLYRERFALCRRLALRRIRAGARLRGYGRYADSMSPESYVLAVIRGRLRDATLSFQLRKGFRVIAVVRGYLDQEVDPASLGYAAIIEWVNRQVATRSDTYGRDRRYAPPRFRLPRPKRGPLER